MPSIVQDQKLDVPFLHEYVCMRASVYLCFFCMPLCVYENVPSIYNQFKDVIYRQSTPNTINPSRPIYYRSTHLTTSQGFTLIHGNCLKLDLKSGPIRSLPAQSRDGPIDIQKSRLSIHFTKRFRFRPDTK